MLGQWVSIAIIAGSVVQAMAAVFFAGQLTRTVREHDRRILELENARLSDALDIARLKQKEGMA